MSHFLSFYLQIAPKKAMPLAVILFLNMALIASGQQSNTVSETQGKLSGATKDGISTIRIEDMIGVATIEQGWNEPRKSLSVGGTHLKLDGIIYQHGIGTHARSIGRINLNGTALRFSAVIGINDTVKVDPGAMPVNIIFYLDNKEVINRKNILPGSKPVVVDIDCKGANLLEWDFEDACQNNYYTHVDVADGKFTYTGTVPPNFFVRDFEPAVRLTPPTASFPKINGAKLIGLRPKSAFIFKVPVTGVLPLKVTVSGLPQGLNYNAETHIITGSVAIKGDYKVTVMASNKAGKATDIITLRVGDTISLTPPMGWNSWNCWGMSVSQDKIMQTADAFVKLGLDNHGWRFVNIDDGWQGVRKGPNMALATNDKFPNMAGLGEAIHAKGLLFGIYSTPWCTSYGGLAGGSADKADGTLYQKRKGYGLNSYHLQDAAQYAAWGVDYLKYDWAPLTEVHTEAMLDALRASDRDIIFSLSNSGDYKLASFFQSHCNALRTTGDIIDNFTSMVGIGFNQQKWAKYARHGYWNDPDMLVIGNLGWSAKLHPTRLSPNEQYTHITQWCMLAAPLLLGCDLSNVDDFTLGLITNDAVIAVNQDALGMQGVRTHLAGQVHVYTKPLADGGTAIAVYNLDRYPVKFNLLPSMVGAEGIKGKIPLQDLWRQAPAGTLTAGGKMLDLPIHGCYFFKTSVALKAGK